MNNEFPPTSNPDPQSLLNQLIIEHLKDQKRKRLWKWVRRILFLIILVVLAFSMRNWGQEELVHNTKPHVGLVDVKGEIGDSKMANADDFAKSLTNAYKNKGLKALILRINSPGGSPVQAEYMYNTINYFKAKYPDVKIHAVCVDLCASAAYYLAVAADDIYASPASMVGSIGVVFNGFGFVDLMSKVGVSRRLQSAGVNKGFLDPFSPVNEAQKQKLQVMLDLIHQQFIKRVKESRGSRLLIDQETFSGLFWTGEQALASGLIDGFGSAGQLARDVIKIDNVIDYTQKQNFIERVTKNIGTAVADELPLSFMGKPGFL